MRRRNHAHDDSHAIGLSERNAQALVGLELFNATWLVGLAAFGLHLIVLGTLIARSTETPRWLGLVMIIAGFAYVMDTTAYTALADYADHAGTFLVMVSVPSVIAEGWFGLWLLTRARRVSPPEPTRRHRTSPQPKE